MYIISAKKRFVNPCFDGVFGPKTEQDFYVPIIWASPASPGINIVGEKIQPVIFCLFCNQIVTIYRCQKRYFAVSFYNTDTESEILL
jgi:hypothetical protein